ncbi:hypothetical protein J5U23_01705 [Saccharolobus shibatae B12]|uniref:Uncharacterized protein n=1 Tax=Saccharolobus shibatae (strain ATCC 51178 / DSM 5389 / JCM 8931 / NBRC 15437 / B12) TaxID=523848 RepID=A0A8F5BP44_SACSH|nr:hypothetical protein J5U23_01705 [Saccharolobus shibatae B12]
MTNFYSLENNFIHLKYLYLLSPPCPTKILESVENVIDQEEGCEPTGYRKLIRISREVEAH